MTNTNELQTPVSGDVQQAVNALADAAAIAQHELAQATADTKNGVLMAIADALDAHASDIADANAMDMQAAFDAGMDQASSTDSNSTSYVWPQRHRVCAM